MNEEDSSIDSIGVHNDKAIDFSSEYSHELTNVARKKYSGLWGFFKSLFNYDIFAKALVTLNDEMVYSKYAISIF